MTTQEEKIIDRVKKLLALSSNNPNIHEASLAWQRAQEMLLQYNLSLDQFEEGKRHKEYIMDSFKTVSKRKWRSRLVHLIATSFLCDCIRSVKSNTVWIIGEKHNIEVVKELSSSIELQMDIMAEMAFVRYGVGNKVVWKQDYVDGCLATLKERFQATKSAQTMALIVVVEEELKAKVKEFFPKVHYTTTRVRASDGYQQGRIGGHNVRIHRELQ